MDIFITVISWIVGLYAFFILGMAAAFSAGGAAQTGKSDLQLMSIGSSLLMIWLIWMGISSVFFSNEVELTDSNSSVKEVKVKTPKVLVDYDTPSVEVSEVSAPSIQIESSPVSTEVKAISADQEILAKVEEKSVDFMLWLFYAIAFILYFSWVFAPSKIKGEGKDLAKKKILASMTLQKDEAGLQAWDYDWKPEEEKESDK